ncbi:MAG TPA: hypothetical protein VGB87_07880 [Vicinamibacteria bacterium]
MKRVSPSIVAFFVASGLAQGQEQAPPLQALVDQPVVSQVTVNNRQLEMHGRLKLHLVATEEELAQDSMRVGGLNLAYSRVPMEAFTGVGPGRPGSDGTGVLSAFLPAVQKVQVFRGLSPGLAVLYGQFEGVVELSQLGDLQQGRAGAAADDKDAVFVSPTQRAALYLLIIVGEDDLKPGRGGGQGEPGILTSVGYSFVAFATQELKVGDLRVPPYVVTQRTYAPFEFELTWLPFEAVRRLCVQPVRIGRITVRGGWPFPVFDVDFTGKGLPFGQPGADAQWRKGDVVFEWRPWKTLWKAGYFTLDIAAGEDAALRAEVSDADCVEVFFVDAFDNPSTWGGGATFSSGLASAKVISSDDNSEAVCAGGACNLTHLAHELGHAMTLHHPGAGGIPAYMVSGTTGTLMCPSGFTADNPRRNSVDNENNVNNPLFQYAFALAGPAPDCTNDAGCGACFTITTP